MRNYAYEVEEILDQAGNEDIWIIYYSEPGLDKCYSLYNLLWNVEFNPSKTVKSYELTHSSFYKMLMQENG